VSFLTITKGGPATDIPDGVYPMTLTAINGPKTVTARRGPNAGSDVELLDWDWAVDEGPYNGYEIQSSSSTATGPRSKVFAYLTALFGGIAPAVGAGFDREHLIGRRVLGTVQHDEGGWPILANVGALPTQMQAPVAQAAQPAPAPVAAVSQPAAPAVPTDTSSMVQQPVAAAVAAPAVQQPADDLPF
jgi:hypothetical protein